MAEVKKDAAAESKAGAEAAIKIKIPYTPGVPMDEQGDEFVSVNDRTWQIQRGKEVEVPVCVYEVLRNRELILETIMEFESTHAKH